jgi:uroporphyrinogen-III synthase
MQPKNNKKILYLGLDPLHYKTEEILIHYPVIRIIPKSPPFSLLTTNQKWTHVILTSKTAVSLFFQSFKDVSACFIAVGKVTEREIKRHSTRACLVANDETQEGVIEVLKTLDLSDAHIFYPHSSKARPLITHYLKENGIRFTDHILYDTVINRETPPPDLSLFDEIVFTSSSTVEAFFEIFRQIPVDKKLTCQGPITQKTLEKFIYISYPSTQEK